MKIGVVIFDGVQSLDISGPLDVFSEANVFLDVAETCSLKTVSLDNITVQCSNGLVIHADYGYLDAPIFDLLLVAGGPNLANKHLNKSQVGYIKRASLEASRFGSICSGAFLLAQTGLLDGRQVTTHWNYVKNFSQRFPKISVAADNIYLKCDNMYTSAGVTAGIDMSLFLVSEIYNSQIALNVAKRLVVAMQRIGGQSQFSPLLTAWVDPTSPVANSQTYILNHYQQEITVQKLADVANMSIRNFSRSFHKQMEITPIEFVLRIRVEAARGMLEQTSLPIKTIAFKAGFNSSSKLRAGFIRQLGVTPAQYRNNFKLRTKH